MSENQKSEEPQQGIVLYADGGCRPNPGFGGWGIHGYLYLDTKPKKGAGCPGHMLTGRGYIEKAGLDVLTEDDAGEFVIVKTDKNTKTPNALAVVGERRQPKSTQEITPVHYIDGFGSFSYPVTNNVGEIVAATHALLHAASFDIKRILILTDSEHVIKGIDGWNGAPPWVEGWMRNGWLKQDGTPPANIELWKTLVKAREALINRGVDIKIRWIKGHDDNFGNDLADRRATLGVMASQRHRAVNEITVTAAEGYWKSAVDRHPFIANRRMYFNTQTNFIRAGEYYLGEHGKDDDLLGKRISDGAFSVVMLEQPDPVLELVRNYQAGLAGEIDTICMVRLDHLYRPDTYLELARHGEIAMEQPSTHRLDLFCLDRQPLTRELRPPKLAMRAVESISELIDKLRQYLAGDTSIIATDLTAVLYETIEKPGKKKSDPAISVMQLKPEYNVGFAALPVEAQYKRGEIIAQAPITLTLGLDLLDRNSLKRLEDMKPKVTLITWLESKQFFRYATIIEVGKDVGIWAGVYSNTRVVPE